jgi:hypothetical protein
LQGLGWGEIQDFKISDFKICYFSICHPGWNIQREVKTTTTTEFEYRYKLAALTANFIFAPQFL